MDELFAVFIACCVGFLAWLGISFFFALEKYYDATSTLQDAGYTNVSVSIPPAGEDTATVTAGICEFKVAIADSPDHYSVVIGEGNPRVILADITAAELQTDPRIPASVKQECFSIS